MLRLAFLCVAAAAAGVIGAGSAGAKTSDGVDWLLVTVSKDMTVFFDNKPGRIERSVEEAAVFTFHVLREPKAVKEGKVAWFMRRSKYDCMKPQVSQLLMIGFDANAEAIVGDYNEKPMVPFGLGTVTEDISIMACDGFSPNGELKHFTSRDAAVAYAKEQMAKK